MKIVCRNDIKQSRYVADIMMKSPRARVAIRIAMAALTSLVTMQWHSASVLAGQYIGNDPVVSAQAERALSAFERWQDNGDTVAYLEYVEARSETAAQVAISTGISPEEVQNAWTAGDLGGQRAALAALTQVGVPYKRYTEEEGVSFDCSGLTGYAWGRAGVDIPRSSRSQYRSADRVGPENAQVGDLAWYPGHIMLYLGVDSLVVHSPARGRTVEYGTLSEDRAGWVRFADPLITEISQR
jgi:cell wall-associated NlpC family hydrolase